MFELDKQRFPDNTSQSKLGDFPETKKVIKYFGLVPDVYLIERGIRLRSEIR